MTTEMRYKTFVLYLGATGCVRLVPVQYHTTIATGPLAYTLVSGQRQVLLRSLDDGAWTESWSSPLVAGPEAENGPRQVRYRYGYTSDSSLLRQH